MFNKLLGGFLCLALAGCSSDSGGEGAASVKPLTPAQKRELKEFSASVNNVGSAANQANRKQKVQRVGMTVLDFRQSDGSLQVPKQKAPRQEKIDFMEGSMDQCQFNENFSDLIEFNDETGNSDEFQRRLESGIYFNVNGDQCPLAMNSNARLTVNQTLGTASGSFSMDFRFNDQQLVDLSRISGARLKGSLDGKGNQSGASAAFTFSGEVDHLDKGLVNIGLRGLMRDNQQGNHSEATLSYGFQDFTAVGTIVSDIDYASGAETAVYRINGEEVTEQEFMEYFAGMLDENLEETPISKDGSFQEGPIDLPDKGSPEFPGIGVNSSVFTSFFQ